MTLSSVNIRSVFIYLYNNNINTNDRTSNHDIDYGYKLFVHRWRLNRRVFLFLFFVGGDTRSCYFFVFIPPCRSWWLYIIDGNNNIFGLRQSVEIIYNNILIYWTNVCYYCIIRKSYTRNRSNFYAVKSITRCDFINLCSSWTTAAATLRDSASPTPFVFSIITV